MKTTCPKCKTTYDIARLSCKRCGYEWQARGDDPSVCASCKSPYWNKDKRLFKKSERRKKNVNPSKFTGKAPRAGFEI